MYNQIKQPILQGSCNNTYMAIESLHRNMFNNTFKCNVAPAASLCISMKTKAAASMKPQQLFGNLIAASKVEVSN